MNSLCPILDCFYGAIPSGDGDEWVAVKVYRDGNPIELGRFSSQDEAEMCAGLEHESDMERRKSK